MNRKLLRQALDALEDSVDLVSNHCQEYIDLYSKYPTRASRIDGKLAGVKAHEDVIKALRAEIAKPEPTPITWAHIENGGIIELSAYYTDYHSTPLYTAPQDCPCESRRVEATDWAAA